jgi:hypothetical protein
MSFEKNCDYLVSCTQNYFRNEHILLKLLKLCDAIVTADNIVFFTREDASKRSRIRD